jgi:hypothetical protein
LYQISHISISNICRFANLPAYVTVFIFCILSSSFWESGNFSVYELSLKNGSLISCNSKSFQYNQFDKIIQEFKNLFYLGKKSGGQKEGQTTGGQPEQPQKTGTEQKAGGHAQVGPSHTEQLQAGGGEPGPSKPPQKQKKKKQQQAQPALPPQVMEVVEGDAGQVQQKKKQVQQEQQQYQPPHPQQPAKSPSSDVSTPRGFDRGQAGIITY